MQIFLYLNNEQAGPFTPEQIQGMIAGGTVAPDTLGWYEGLDGWKPVSEIPALAGEAASGPPALEEPAALSPATPQPQAASLGEGEVILHVEHQATYSRLQMLARFLFGWLYIGIPHGICISFLGIAWVVCSVIAWFAILFTGRHPEGLFNFVNLTKQWHVRVMASLLNLVDGYPSFGLGNKGDKVNYLINRQATYGRLHCLLRLFPFILYVAIPHGIYGFFRTIASVFVNLIAFFAVLFTGKYPKGLHDFQVGTLRWQLRLLAYTSSMSDKYPRFSGAH